MELHLWWAYVAAAFLISISPGSGALLTMTHSMARGVRGAAPAVWGLQAGLVVILLISGLGLGAVLVASEQAFTAVKWAGAAYLFWLGFSQWRAASASEVDGDGDGEGADAALRGPAQPATSGWRLAVTADTSARTCFMQGVLTNVTNPKGIVFMVAVLPQFIDPARPLWLQLAIISATSVTIDYLVMRHGYATVAWGLQRLMQRPGARRMRDRLFGGVLMGLGVSLLFVRRTAG